MTSQYIILLIFGAVLYFVVTDESVAAAFYYAVRLIRSKVDYRIWWLKNDPSNPIVKHLIYRRNLKLAKELKAKIDKHYEENK